MKIGGLRIEEVTYGIEKEKGQEEKELRKLARRNALRAGDNLLPPNHVVALKVSKSDFDEHVERDFNDHRILASSIANLQRDIRELKQLLKASE